MENQEFNNNNISAVASGDSDPDVPMATVSGGDVSVTATISGVSSRSSKSPNTSPATSGRATTGTVASTSIVTSTSTVTSAGDSRPGSSHGLVGGSLDPGLDID